MPFRSSPLPRWHLRRLLFAHRDRPDRNPPIMPALFPTSQTDAHHQEASPRLFAPKLLRRAPSPGPTSTSGRSITELSPVPTIAVSSLGGG